MRKLSASLILASMSVFALATAPMQARLVYKATTNIPHGIRTTTVRTGPLGRRRVIRMRTNRHGIVHRRVIVRGPMGVRVRGH